jgi:hypothetical protein
MNTTTIFFNTLFVFKILKFYALMGNYLAFYKTGTYFVYFIHLQGIIQ